MFANRLSDRAVTQRFFETDADTALLQIQLRWNWFSTAHADDKDFRNSRSSVGQNGFPVGYVEIQEQDPGVGIRIDRKECCLSIRFERPVPIRA
jgi:hypothetical protein